MQVNGINVLLRGRRGFSMKDIYDLCIAEQFETLYLLLRQGNSQQYTTLHLNSYKHIRTWNSRKKLRLRECYFGNINNFMLWQETIHWRLCSMDIINNFSVHASEWNYTMTLRRQITLMFYQEAVEDFLSKTLIYVL